MRYTMPTITDIDGSVNISSELDWSFMGDCSSHLDFRKSKKRFK